MFQDLRERLTSIATEDNDREDRLGCRCPIKLDLFMVGGHELREVCLVDGENSLDHASIDVCRYPDGRSSDDNHTVAIAHIAMFRHVWPSEADEQAALKRAGLSAR